LRSKVGAKGEGGLEDLKKLEIECTNNSAKIIVNQKKRGEMLSPFNNPKSPSKIPKNRKSLQSNFA
jgi:hypothetical protein